MDAHHLTQNVTFIPRAETAVVNAYLPWTQICTSGLSRMEMQDHLVKNARRFEVQVTAWLREPLEVYEDHPVFMLECTDGTTYLVGTYHRPYPTITQTMVSSDKVSEGCRAKLDIKFVSGEPLFVLINS